MTENTSIDPPAGRLGLKFSAWSCLALLAVLALCYAGTFEGAWLYDDFPNIVENEKIRVTQWSWRQFSDSFSAGLAHQTVSRPLAYLSFALNHRLGGTQVTGYHLVNFVIHWLSAVFLLLFMRRLLRLPVLEGRYRRHADLIALTAAILWASHPIQVTAVTYVVQRMTSMAGLFYVMTLYFYLLGRTARSDRGRWAAYGLGGLTAACGLLTKENTVLVFYAIWLLDLLLMRDVRRRLPGRHLLWLVAMTLPLCGLGLLYIDPRNLIQSFEMRPFTMTERLLTEPRVVFFYLSLIAFPMTSRMSMLHDIEISRSLWMPWTTSAAIAGLVLGVALLIAVARRYPLMAYCGLFFFLNHAIEGSIFNLELIYEHRNYVPSMLLFLPLSVAALKGVQLFADRRMLRVAIATVVMFMIASQTHSTVVYNRVFASGFTLWSDVVVKYPRLSLGHLNLGNEFWEAGRFERAVRIYHDALGNDRFFNLHQKGLVYFNLGFYEALRQNNPEQAGIYFRRAREIYPTPEIARRVAKAWLEAGQPKKALENLLDAGRLWGEDAALHRMIAVAYLKQGDGEMARKHSANALQADAQDPMALMVRAQSHRLAGELHIALNYLEAMLEKHPDHMGVLMALIEVCDDLGLSDRVGTLIDRLMRLRRVQNSAVPDTLRVRGAVGPGDLMARKAGIMPYVPDRKRLERLLAAHGADARPTTPQ